MPCIRFPSFTDLVDGAGVDVRRGRDAALAARPQRLQQEGLAPYVLIGKDD